MGKEEKVIKLKEKIAELESSISSRCKSIEAKATEEANDCVTDEMEATGNTRSQAFSKVYNDAYSNEVKVIQQLNFRKQLAEVELFIVFEQPSSDLKSKGWSKEMLDYYEVRIAELSKGGNGNNNDKRFDSEMVEEVGEDSSAHALFMTQNNVSGVVDASIAGMGTSGDGGTSSYIQ